MRGANPSPLCWDLATTIRARQPIYTAHPILIYAQPHPFPENKETFTFTFLRERFSLEIYETAQMSSASLSSLGRFLILNRILIEMMPHLKQILILLYFLQHYGRKRAI